MGPVHKIPAEVTNPADMWGQTDFHAATDLADCPRFTVGVKISQNVGTFTIRKRISFAPAEDRTASAKNVGRKAGAGDRVTQRQGA